MQITLDVCLPLRDGKGYVTASKWLFLSCVAGPRCSAKIWESAQHRANNSPPASFEQLGRADTWTHATVLYCVLGRGEGAVRICPLTCLARA